MPKPQEPCRSLPAPIQLPLFPEEASLVRIRPVRNEWRYCRLAVWPDLFGLDSNSHADAAVNALVRTERRRGYWDRRA